MLPPELAELDVFATSHARRLGLSDADRNCISNIYPPDGLGYAAAAAVTAALVAGARALGRSGVDLKDTSRQELDTATVVSLEPADPDT